MYPMGDDLLSTPAMYQDLGSMSMRPMGMPLGLGGMYGGMNTSYLGGTRMQPQIDNDKYVTMKSKDNGDRKTMKIALAVFAGLLAFTSIGRISKGIKKSGGLDNYLTKQFDYVKDLFKSKPNKPSLIDRWKNYRAAKKAAKAGTP